MTPKWFWYVASAALVAIAAAAILYAVSAGDNGRWVSEAGGAMVLDTRTGTMCIVNGEACFPAPQRSSPLRTSNMPQETSAVVEPATSGSDTTPNPFDEIFRDTSAVRERNSGRP